MNSLIIEVGGIAAMSAGWRAVMRVRKVVSSWAFSYAGEDSAMA